MDTLFYTSGARNLVNSPESINEIQCWQAHSVRKFTIVTDAKFITADRI